MAKSTSLNSRMASAEEEPSSEEPIQMCALAALIVAIDYERAVEAPGLDGTMTYIIERFGATTPERLHRLFHEAAQQLGAGNEDHSSREALLVRYGTHSSFQFVYVPKRRVYTLLQANSGKKEFDVMGNIRGFDLE